VRAAGSGPPGAEIVLHHYDISPFSEKVRLALGIKNARWRSVRVPEVMPKPDLLPLTGGYRRTPVMQIGADVYCDTARILRELERRLPEPPLERGAAGGPAWALAFWSDRTFFQATVALVFGSLGDAVPEGFVKDREALMQRRFDPSAMKAALPAARDQVRAHLAFVDTALGRGADFLDGDAPGLSDVHAYFNLWFLARALPPARALWEDMPRLIAWKARLDAQPRGHPEPLEPAGALTMAREAAPSARPIRDEHDAQELAPGERVRVMPEDYGFDPVEGELVAANALELAVRRRAPEVGEVVVHFPRAGFAVSRVREGA